jgi:hypothetical protein
MLTVTVVEEPVPPPLDGVGLVGVLADPPPPPQAGSSADAASSIAIPVFLMQKASDGGP